jgi:hypothetical protein
VSGITIVRSSGQSDPDPDPDGYYAHLESLGFRRAGSPPKAKARTSRSPSPKPVAPKPVAPKPSAWTADRGWCRADVEDIDVEILEQLAEDLDTTMAIAKRRALAGEIDDDSLYTASFAVGRARSRRKDQAQRRAQIAADREQCAVDAASFAEEPTFTPEQATKIETAIERDIKAVTGLGYMARDQALAEVQKLSPGLVANYRRIQKAKG